MGFQATSFGNESQPAGCLIEDGSLADVLLVPASTYKNISMIDEAKV